MTFTSSQYPKTKILKNKIQLHVLKNIGHPRVEQVLLNHCSVLYGGEMHPFVCLSFNAILRIAIYTNHTKSRFSIQVDSRNSLTKKVLIGLSLMGFMSAKPYVLVFTNSW